MLEPAAAILGPDAPTELTATEQLLLDTGFHPTTARAFSDFDYGAVRSELHKQDLLAWLPQEDRDRRIGRLVMRWRRVKPEAAGRQQQAESSRQVADATESSDRRPLATNHRSSQEAVTRYELRDEAPVSVRDEPEPLELCEEEPLDPWTERARRLRPAWTSKQQGALARALRHAPNDAAAIMMAQVSLGRAQRC